MEHRDDVPTIDGIGNGKDLITQPNTTLLDIQTYAKDNHVDIIVCPETRTEPKEWRIVLGA